MKYLLIAWISCQSLDIATTKYALNKGMIEINPIPHLTYVKISVNTGALLINRRIKSKIIPTIFTVAGCIPAGLNIREIKK